MFDTITVEIKGDIAVITLNRPEKLNASTPHMRDELAQALDEIESNDEVRVAIVTGAGRVFCAGADRQSLTGGKLSAGLEVEERLINFKKPIIAAVKGYALGFGAVTMLLCDIAIIAEGTKIGFIGALAGVLCTAALNYLPIQVGRGKALELMLTSEHIDAAEALRIGLVNKVVPPDKLMDAAFDMAERIKRVAPLSANFTKQGVAINHRGIGNKDFLDRALAVIEVSEDREEAARAFFENREPHWTGS